MTIQVLVADDERLVRAGYRMILRDQIGIEVVGEAEDGLGAVEQARRLHPDVVLMDVRMPHLDGIAATRRIAATRPAPAVLVVTTFDLDEYVYEALRAGACGFLLKDAPEDQLVAALHSATAGVSLLSPTVTRRLVETFATQATAAPIEGLTDRETDVLAQVALGRSNSEIARALTISETTVKSHVSNLLMKLGLASRTQAVVVAYETGLIRPGQHLEPNPADHSPDAL